ncbi:MAG: polysaccharide pyruvyl transferase family protein [Pseudomonadota bacterium]
MWFRKPTVEIVGVWLPNKGAELMAWAVKSELGKRLDRIRFVRTPQGPDEDQARLDFIPKQLPPRKQPPLRVRLMEHVDRLNPASNSPIIERDITHYIDISGFAYGDFWGLKKAKMRAGTLIETGRPVYLLPQAFGPFSERGLAEVMGQICRRAAMVCARDRQSHEFLKKAAPNDPVRLLPDITFSLDFAERQVERPDTDYGCLIVNSMLQRSDTASEAETIALFLKTGEALRAHGIEPMVVVHEPARDSELSQALADQLQTTLIALDDARDLKAFIGGARIAVTGRFHGLVNALSSGVPAFAVGWSHKYQEMLADFAMPDAWYNSDDDAFVDRINAFLSDDAGMSATKPRLLQTAQEKRAALAPFWDELADHIQRSR